MEGFEEIVKLVIDFHIKIKGENQTLASLRNLLLLKLMSEKIKVPLEGKDND
jgi:hypothetical protein